FAEVRVDDAVITREVIWRVGHAVLVQIGGRANDDDADGAQPADDQAGICRPTDAYGHIEAFVEQIDHPVREAHVELDIRITGGEGIEGWCKLQDAKGERRRQAKPSPRRLGDVADVEIQRVELVDDRAQTLVIGPARLGWRYRSRRPVEKPHTKVGFEPRNQL